MFFFLKYFRQQVVACFYSVPKLVRLVSSADGYAAPGFPTGPVDLVVGVLRIPAAVPADPYAYMLGWDWFTAYWF